MQAKQLILVGVGSVVVLAVWVAHRRWPHLRLHEPVNQPGTTAGAENASAVSVASDGLTMPTEATERIYVDNSTKTSGYSVAHGTSVAEEQLKPDTEATARNSGDGQSSTTLTSSSQLPPPASTGIETSPSIASGSPSSELPRKEQAVAKGFFNKPKKKSASTTAPSVESGVAAQQVADSALLFGHDRGGEHASKQIAVDDDSEDVGAVALRKAHETINQEQTAGTSEFERGCYGEARDAFLRMRDAARAAGLSREEGQACRLLATALDKMDAPEAEIEAAFKKALTNAHRQNDMELAFNVLNGMGSHAIKIEDLDDAEHLFLQSLTLAKRVLSTKEEAVAEANLGMCLSQSESRRAESFNHFRRAIHLNQRPDANPLSVANLRCNLADALSIHGKLKEAESEYEKALTLAGTAGSRRLELDIIASLSDLYEYKLNAPQKVGMCQQALETLREHKHSGPAINLMEAMRKEVEKSNLK